MTAIIALIAGSIFLLEYLFLTDFGLKGWSLLCVFASAVRIEISDYHIIFSNNILTKRYLGSMPSDELGDKSADSPAKKQRCAQDVEDSAASVSQTNTNFLTHLNKQMLSQLECPVCHVTCLPPIFMCSNGHIVCEKCQPWRKECSVCCAPGKPRSRCVQLEKIAEQLMYPCPYKSSGCTLVLCCSKISEHILKCEYGLECLVCEKWNGTLKDLKAHVETEHPEICNTIPSTGSIVRRKSKPTDADVKDIEVFFYNDELFWAHSYFFSINLWYLIDLQIASNDLEKASRYIYSVDFKAKNLKNNFNVFHQRDVQTMKGNDSGMIIVIPDPIINSFEDEIVEYTLNISVK